MRARIIIDADICKGCTLCVQVCPKQVMELDKSKLNARGYHAAVCTDEAACIACAMCAMMCPDSAITVIKEE
ncbi:MAG: 4Fe-4S binding protein [Oscillospiraceae bacterium]|nr:4Fe-4S binding protein [Oscillospiraceae bacterium]